LDDWTWFGIRKYQPLKFDVSHIALFCGMPWPFELSAAKKSMQKKTQTMNNTMDKKVHNKDNSKIRQQEKD